ncbi:hypothetical protein [Loktanella salsilacus]|uniref:hypothetical protein n=1 Tax=Loktanella salsilacus TaxID=195913 RepID=UPI0020B7A840|nr:hypothetical protein [Loktanella salsilacus]UTH45764.1 hypothetical protein KBK07_06990 [Loktanella salsilacus]
MFTLLCIATAVLCAVLFAVFLIAPGAYMALYGVTADASAVFIGRRASPLFLGLAVFFWLLRDAGPGPLQDGTALAAAVTFAGIAATGIWSYAAGSASFAILVAAVFEAAIAVAFVLAR